MSTWKWKGDVLLGTNGLSFLSGTGDPTGVVSAPPGSLFLRSDGGAGTGIYVKESGTGSSGWAAIRTSGSGSIVLRVNGVNTSLQTVLNLTGTGVSITDAGSGEVHINVTAAGLVYSNGSITNVQQALDKALYVAPAISISNDIGTVELGTTLTAINVSWTLNKVVSSLSFTAVDSHLAPGTAPVAISPTSLVNQLFAGSYRPSVPVDLDYTLTAGDGTSTVSATTKVFVQPKVYWGASALTALISSQIVSLPNSAFALSVDQTAVYDCTGGKYPYFCYPSSFGSLTAVFVNGVPFTNYTVSTVLVTNAAGFTQNYNVVRFTGIQTGLMTVKWNGLPETNDDSLIASLQDLGLLSPSGKLLLPKGFNVADQKRFSIITRQGGAGPVPPQAVGDDFSTFGSIIVADVNPTSDLGASITYQASGGAIDVAYGFNGDLYFRTGRGVAGWAAVYFPGTTDVRNYYALSDVADGVIDTFGQTDTPTGSFAAFRFSTLAGDTNWKCMTSNGSSITVVDSGVVYDNKEHVFAIQMDDVNGVIRFYIDKLLVASITTTRPAAGINLRFLVSSCKHVTPPNSSDLIGLGQIQTFVDF